MKTLIIIDKFKWAYDSICQSIMKYNQDKDLSLKMTALKGNKKEIKKIHSKFDRFFVMGWQNYADIDFLPKKQTLVGIHSYHSWDNKISLPGQEASPPASLIDFLSGFKGVNAVSQNLTNLFIKHGLQKVVYTPNGVDTDIFIPQPLPNDKRLKIGYSGSSAHDWRKGVSEFIIPAAQKAGVDIKLAMLSTDDYVPLDKMPAFYKDIDCYICASSSEGMSLSVLEAAACGRPVIGTKISGNIEIIKNDLTGFFVNRNIKDISDKIAILRDDREKLKNMSLAVAEDIKKNFSWEKQSKAWLSFIKDS